MFKCFNVWLFKGSTSSRWTTSSRRACSRPERRRRPWSDSLTFKPCLTREWRSFLRMRWGVLLSSSRSRRSTCEYIHLASSFFGPSFAGLKSGVVSRPHNDYLFFRIILNRCMISFMNPKVDFEDLNRFQRISCIKVNFYKKNTHFSRLDHVLLPHWISSIIYILNNLKYSEILKLGFKCNKLQKNLILHQAWTTGFRGLASCLLLRVL